MTFEIFCCSGDAQRQGGELAPRFPLQGEGAGGVRGVRSSSSRRRNVPSGEWPRSIIEFPRIREAVAEPFPTKFRDTGEKERQREGGREIIKRLVHHLRAANTVACGMIGYGMDRVFVSPVHSFNDAHLDFLMDRPMNQWVAG